MDFTLMGLLLESNYLGYYYLSKLALPVQLHVVVQ
jgi:hypothetical protein